MNPSINVIAGATIRMINTFYNFDGIPQDPDLVKFKVYDATYKLLGDYQLMDGNRLSEGKYCYDYVIPKDSRQILILEFYGEISGNPTIARQRITTTFV